METKNSENFYTIPYVSNSNFWTFVLEEFGLNSQVANGDLHQNDLADGQSSLNTRSMV